MQRAPGAGPEPTLEDLVAKIAPVDLLLVEGYKRDPAPEDRGAPRGDGHFRSSLRATTRSAAIASDTPSTGTDGRCSTSTIRARSRTFIAGEVGL